MTTRPPFPTVWDSSMLASLKRCPQHFYKQNIWNWRSKEDSVHLVAGGAFAKGMEVARNAFFCGVYEVPRVVNKNVEWTKESGPAGNAEDAIAAGLQALIAHYGDFQCPADSAKSLERTCGAFEFYFSNYPLALDVDPPIVLPSGKRGIEFNFVEPIELLHPETEEPLLYCGRMDAILEAFGGRFICDEKTTTSLGATWSRQWELRSQFTGYKWGCKQNGIAVDGVLVRGVSILKTKYETQQAVSYRPEWQVDRWYTELLDWINDAISAWKTDRWRYNLDDSCSNFGGCSFRQACANQDESEWLKLNFTRKHWDPITRTETSIETADEPGR